MKKFKVIDGYVGEEGHEVEAHDHEHAAEVYAEWEDSFTADYSIVGDFPEKVTVIGHDGVTKHFTVYGETTPTYRAEENRP